MDSSSVWLELSVIDVVYEDCPAFVLSFVTALALLFHGRSGRRYLLEARSVPMFARWAVQRFLPQKAIGLRLRRAGVNGNAGKRGAGARRHSLK